MTTRRSHSSASMRLISRMAVVLPTPGRPAGLQHGGRRRAVLEPPCGLPAEWKAAVQAAGRALRGAEQDAGALAGRPRTQHQDALAAASQVGDHGGTACRQRSEAEWSERRAVHGTRTAMGRQAASPAH